MAVSCLNHQCRHTHQGHPCLLSVPIFSRLDSSELSEIASITVERTIEKSQGIYRAGSMSKNLYVLHEGLVKIYRTSFDGKEHIVRIVKPGEFFGELTLFSDTAMSDHADAIEACTMCIIQGDKLKMLMSEHPSIALNILTQLSLRLEQTESQLEQLRLESAEQRLARYIIKLANGSDRCSLVMSKGETASHLGMNQETLSRKLALWQDSRIITLQGQRSILILQPETLQSIAEG